MATDERLAQIRARADNLAAVREVGSADFAGLMRDQLYAVAVAYHQDVPVLLAEVARLRAEGRRMTALHVRTVEELDAARADGERLRDVIAVWDKSLPVYDRMADDNERLRAENAKMRAALADAVAALERVQPQVRGALVMEDAAQAITVARALLARADGDAGEGGNE